MTTTFPTATFSFIAGGRTKRPFLYNYYKPVWSEAHAVQLAGYARGAIILGNEDSSIRLLMFKLRTDFTNHISRPYLLAEKVLSPLDELRAAALELTHKIGLANPSANIRSMPFNRIDRLSHALLYAARSEQPPEATQIAGLLCGLGFAESTKPREDAESVDIVQTIQDFAYKVLDKKKKLASKGFRVQDLFYYPVGPDTNKMTPVPEGAVILSKQADTVLARRPVGSAGFITNQSLIAK